MRDFPPATTTPDHRVLISDLSLKSEPQRRDKKQGVPLQSPQFSDGVAPRHRRLFALVPSPFRTQAHNNAPGERKPPGGPAQAAERTPRPLVPPACPVSSFRTTFPGPTSDPGPQTQPRECRRGSPQALQGASAPGRVAVPAPSLPVLPVPVPVRARDHAAPDAAPRAAGCRASPAPVPDFSRPGPRSPFPRYSPPTRYILAAMAVPAAASGRTKGSGRLAGAGLGSRRSPERGAGASRKSRSGPRSRHLRCLSRRGSSRPALSPPQLPPHARDAEASAGPLGLFRNKLGSRRTGARF